MKRLLTILAFIIIAITSNAQQKYKPSLHAGPQNKPSGISSATPLDSRAYFYDTTTHTYRPYANRAEVLSYLYLASYRSGQFTIIIDSASHKWAYWFRDSTRDQDLVLQYNFAAATTDSSVFATLYRVDTAKVNLRNSIAGKISTTLPTGQILAGNLSNVATPVTPSGVLTMTSGGSFDYVGNSITYPKLQTLPARSVFGNPTGSTANSRATYMGYGTLFDSDTLKVDTSLLKVVFGGGGGGGNTNSNIGSGYRWAVPGTNNVKTVFGGYAFNWDSTSNANALTGTVDSAVLANYFLRRKDSTLYATVTAISGKLSNTLASQHMFVGNGSNVAVDAGNKLKFDVGNSLLTADSLYLTGSIRQSLDAGLLSMVTTTQGLGVYMRAIDQTYVNPNGIRDVVLTDGWNLNGYGGRLNNSLSGFGWGHESLFASGPAYQNEHYFYGISRSGIYHRWIAFNVDDSLGKAYMYTQLDALQMFATDSTGAVYGQPYFAAGPSGSTVQSETDAPAFFDIANPTHPSTYGDLRIETQTDGSTNITNNNGKIDLNSITTELTGAGAYPLIINQADFYNGKGIYIIGHVTGPSYPIHIATASDADQYLYNQNTGNGNAVAQMWSNTANVGYILSNGGSFHWTMGSKHVGEDFTISSNTGYFNAGEKFLIQRSGNIGIGGNITPAVGLATSDTGAWKIPVGTTAQRPTGDTGYIRFNSLVGFEGFDGASWVALSGGGGGIIPPNLGSAYRVYAPQTPGFKTLAKQYGILIDSATTGQLGFTLDSATVYTYVRSLITGSDTLKLAFAGTGERPFWASNDTLHGKTIKGLNSLIAASGPDSTINLQLVNDTAIGTAANYYYGTNSAGRRGFYSLSGIAGVTTMGAFGSTPNSNGASISGSTLTLQPANGSNPGGISTTTQTLAGAKTFSADVSLPHIVGTTSTPSIAAGTGAGTSPTISIAGNDMAGTITVVAGTLPTAGQVIATITFTTTLSSTPRIILQPANQAVGSGIVFPTISVSGSTTQFYINTNTVTGLGAGFTYSWNYIVVQ